jgi:hypothetical protein
MPCSIKKVRIGHLSEKNRIFYSAGGYLSVLSKVDHILLTIIFHFLNKAALNVHETYSLKKLSCKNLRISEFFPKTIPREPLI